MTGGTACPPHPQPGRHMTAGRFARHGPGLTESEVGRGLLPALAVPPRKVLR
jgi:hypothetical protein